MSTSPRKPDPPRTRVAGLWISSVLFALVLLLLLIFALQNNQRAKVSFFGWHANVPLGVALLLAAVFGVLLVALPGTARIVQLRVLARGRNRTAPPLTPAPDVPHTPDAPDSPLQSVMPADQAVEPGPPAAPATEPAAPANPAVAIPPDEPTRTQS